VSATVRYMLQLWGFAHPGPPALPAIAPPQVAGQMIRTCCSNRFLRATGRGVPQLCRGQVNPPHMGMRTSFQPPVHGEQIRQWRWRSCAGHSQALMNPSRATFMRVPHVDVVVPS